MEHTLTWTQEGSDIWHANQGNDRFGIVKVGLLHTLYHNGYAVLRYAGLQDCKDAAETRMANDE